MNACRHRHCQHISRGDSGGGCWEDLICVDVSPPRVPTDPMLIVQARKPLEQ